MHVGHAIHRHVRPQLGSLWRLNAAALSLLSFQHQLLALIRDDLYTPNPGSPRAPPPNSPRFASSSSTRWKARQSNDTATRAAKLAGLKSRAAFKLLEINAAHKFFKPGDTVVDLGFAPGSWSQVAAARTAPNGRVIGIDVLPATPPKGVSTLQGDFLSEEIQAEVRRFVRDPLRGRPRVVGARGVDDVDGLEGEEGDALIQTGEGEKTVMERGDGLSSRDGGTGTTAQRDLIDGRVVNVVLSDMSAPWPPAPTASMWLRSVSNPYRRMMNTSGMTFRDHAGSMVSSILLSSVVSSYTSG